MDAELVVTRLAALAQTTRLAIFRLLVVAGPEGLIVGRIAEQLGVPAATLSFHLKELSQAGLIVGKQQGRYIQYVADFAAMTELTGFLTENCCSGEPCGVEVAVCCPPESPTLFAIGEPQRK